ncbi:glucose-1-phosphate adenylyltransferase [Candidatus Borkfalkia ceftriaxoniphila]|uniref:Glucose-1-phosphate adenylyltransferase n=1 Tax=Candidatus Borkfalkia ceftriaxoniphila TaxID=2508949 RepID=A0A4Q2K519_9FIRM|nr:glucose-1-phosphate adenylyltransferase [Candidatus Borkfalkia ceftriaxoniphila]RXZ57929.1 glucose-1-phosphate adenylyltransferase [Candidatus Borkfalkia ceftriaxoniphila]
MQRKKECVAMLLAGGQGSRLYALTNNIAKPAVPFGAKYRIIDFPLSNCINSGIDTVGVLTQYQPLVLNEYIGNGQPWDLDRTFGGVHVLSPYQKKSKSAWYEGTANAIYQNINFIKMYNPEYVLILSGDHIYKMDYSKMLRAHVENVASCTIAAINVTMQEASRFGILNTREDGTIYEFEEKPKQPKSTLASMGIYIFTAQKLYDYLEEDDSNPSSSKDFGKDVLPAMLAAGEKMVAYSFDGYWKDVGTISSLWEANMDLLGDDPAFDVSNSDWKIHSRNPLAPPEYVGEDAIIKNSMIALGCEIEGTVINSLLSSNVIVKKGAFVKDSVIMSGTVIEEDARVTYAIIDEDVTVSRGAVIGEERTSKKGIAVLGRNIVVEEGAILAGGNIVDKNVLKGGK